MQIGSSRLTYHPITESDWPFFLALYQDQNVMRFVADPRDADEIRRVAFNVRLPPWQRGSKHWLCLVLREKTSGDRVGVSGFIDRGHNSAEVGYLLSAAFHGNGYGTESLRAICQAAFALGFSKLTATVTTGNLASKAVLEKVGFMQEAILRESYYLNGRWQDDEIFALLPPAGPAATEG
ncbi:GNAT family N-acetyltransferase [Pantoea alhagi]|uniref:GNAT family N-acetyltransferase n=1 Tax=Pantoea alhagi TaxID=1891675 RepID=A0A1W6B5L2_9GAMM|nr:GNAT family protein [Pantoea alhagi]ARJ42380.1 GNAT family N-acetyltransferase [Pantoea alhagi]